VSGIGGGGARSTAAYFFGVEIDHGRMVILLRKGEPLPARGRRLFTTVTDHQAAVEVHVLRGSGEPGSEAAGDGQDGAVSIGRFLLTGIHQGARGKPRIEVSLEVDAEGMVRAAARDLDTGCAQQVVFSQDLPFEHPQGEGPEILRMRVVSLVQRVRSESAALPRREHAGLRREIDDMVAGSISALASAGWDDLQDYRTALETLLGEIRAVRGLGAVQAQAGGFSNG
jgi:molecular chaperone DnaK